MSIRNHLEAFLERLEKLEETDEKGEDGYCKEYTDLRLRTQRYRQSPKQMIPATEGKKECNIKKNRYKDIVPYDATRVKLSNVDNVEGQDYINANFVTNASGQPGYIAAQGPLPHTVDDFVRMLWEYEVRVVIMACNEFEAGKHKCQRYWANSPEEALTFGPITIKLRSIKESESFTERQLLLCVEGEDERIVSHFHFPAWPDHMVPTCVDAVLDMIARARSCQPHPSSPPIVVHCSAGCGRTGTIIAVDYIWSQLKYARVDGTLSIYEILKKMRQQRPSAVQSAEQYIFLHFTIKHLFEQHLAIMDQHIYENCATSDEAQATKDGDVVYEGIWNSSAGPTSPMLKSQSSSEPTSPALLVIQETVDKLLEQEFSSPHAPSPDPESALYADPAPSKKPKPHRPPSLPTYENDNFSNPPALPPKTEESTQLVDVEDEDRGYANTKPPVSPMKPPVSPTRPPASHKPPVNGRKPMIPNVKGEQSSKPTPTPRPNLNTNPFKVRAKPEPPAAKPNFVGSELLVPTPVAEKTSHSANEESAKPAIVNVPVEGYMNVKPTRDPHRNSRPKKAERMAPAQTQAANVSVVSISGDSSQVVHTNRESTLHNYSAISDYMSGTPATHNTSSSNVTQKNTMNAPPDYELVKNPFYEGGDARGDARGTDGDKESVHVPLSAVDNKKTQQTLSSSTSCEYSLVSDWTSGDPSSPKSGSSEAYSLAQEPKPLQQSASYHYAVEKASKPTTYDPYEEVENEAYSLATGYAYADEKARNKWSLQHYALKGEEAQPYGPPKPARATETHDPAYEAVSFDQDDVFEETAGRSMRYDAGEGSDEDNISISSQNMGSGNTIGTVTRAFGQMFRKKMKFNFGSGGSGSGSGSGISSEEFFALNNLHIYFKGADINYPSRVGKPKGPRDPRGLQQQQQQQQQQQR